MKIRKAILSDMLEIGKVHVDSWRTTYKDILSEEFLNQLSYEKRHKLWKDNFSELQIYVAENNNGEAVGFSVGEKERTGNYFNYVGELYAIYILEEFQRKGIGKLLFCRVVEELKKADMNSMLVWVLEDNSSKYFYESLGGTKIDSIEIQMDGKKLNQIAYGWRSLNNISI